MKEWISLVWPICNRDITTCSLLNFFDAGLHFPKVGCIWKSLLWMLLLHCCCHFVWRNLLIVGFRSVYGILDLSGFRSKADLAAESALYISNLYVIRLFAERPLEQNISWKWSMSFKVIFPVFWTNSFCVDTFLNQLINQQKPLLLKDVTNCTEFKFRIFLK